MVKEMVAQDLGVSSETERASHIRRLRERRMTAKVCFPLQGKRVFVAGHKGLAGSAIKRRLELEACEI